MRTRGFEFVREEFKKNKNGETVQLPLRATKSSAGYDFFTPVEIHLQPGEQRVVWTDVKAYMQDEEMLVLDVRSSIGIKKGLILANILGVIDQDYYSNPGNDGNIGICLKNISNQEVRIPAQEGIAQGIFIPFLVADNCNSENERIGGIGSTNK